MWGNTLNLGRDGGCVIQSRGKDHNSSSYDASVFITVHDWARSAPEKRGALLHSFIISPVWLDSKKGGFDVHPLHYSFIFQQIEGGADPRIHKTRTAARITRTAVPWCGMARRE